LLSAHDESGALALFACNFPITKLDVQNAKAPDSSETRSFNEIRSHFFQLTFEMANSKGGPAMFGSKWHLSRNAHLPKRRSQRGYKESSKTLFGIFRKKNLAL